MVESGDSASTAQREVGLALSGGGFRATLFHIGSLWRLNELGVFPRLREVTSVSGGSITSAWLGCVWKQLTFDAQGVAGDFERRVADPLRALCRHTVDVGQILGGILSPFHHPSELLAASYDKHLFRSTTLRDLPADGEGPRFTIYAASLQTGASVRISRPYLADYHLGRYPDPDLSLARVVAASSAFPPPLCPVTIELDADRWTQDIGADLFGRRALRERLLLTDGGVYDNLGLERIWDRDPTVLVSDAGAPLEIVDDSRLIRWSQLARTKRVLDVVSSQVRALRVRRMIGDFESGLRKGAYWGIGTRIGDYPLEQHGLARALVRDSATTEAQARVRTRLNRFSDREQGQLINWGYALADAAMRARVGVAAPPGRLPVADHPL